ncbi:MAG: class I tRNA ligase family protein, partial [Candidatus Syntropharchaeia archaeon]
MDFKSVEEKWKRKWEEAKVFQTDFSEKDKFFTSLVIPYANGDLHIGHGFTFTRTDAYARFKRMQGYNTLLAMGIHATGQPILGSLERLRRGDEIQVKTFKEYGATEEDMK